MAHAATPVPDPRQFRKDLCPALAAVLVKTLQKEPANRFANAEEMHAALDAALVEQAAQPAAAAPPPPPPPPPPAAVQARASDPERTAELGERHPAPPPPPPPPPAAAVTPTYVPARSKYAGELPKAHGVVQYKQKRHWGRVIVVWLVLAALLAGVIWFLAPRIRKLSLSSQHVTPADSSWPDAARSTVFRS